MGANKAIFPSNVLPLPPEVKFEHEIGGGFGFWIGGYFGWRFAHVAYLRHAQILDKYIDFGGEVRPRQPLWPGSWQSRGPVGPGNLTDSHGVS